MPRKSAPRYNIQLSHAMRLRRLFHPFYRAPNEMAPVEKVSRDAIVQEMVREGLVRIRTRGSPAAERVLFGQTKPTSFINIQVTRLGRAKILANKLARSGKFENLGQYFDVKGVNLVRKGKNRKLQIQTMVATAYIIQLMLDLALERVRVWKKMHRSKIVPENLLPKFSRRELLEALEDETLTRKDRRESSISQAERKKNFQRPPRYDDLHPDQRRFQIEREKIIDFATFLLENKIHWKEIQDEFAELWSEYQLLKKFRENKKEKS